MSHATPHRLLYFFVAFVLLMFFGLIYAWSLFVDPLEAEFGWDRSATSVVFTLSIITFCAGMLVAGALDAFAVDFKAKLGELPGGKRKHGGVNGETKQGVGPVLHFSDFACYPISHVFLLF